MEMMTDLAIAVFSEALADKIEDIEVEGETNLLSFAEIAQIQNSYIMGEDLTKSIPELFSDFGLSIQDYLPVKEIHKIVNKVDFQWRGKLTFEALYEHNANAACNFLLDIIGQSVSSEKNMDIESLFVLKGVKTPIDKFPVDCDLEVIQSIRDLGLAFKKRNGAILLRNDESAWN
jgi:hypothetical protein